MPQLGNRVQTTTKPSFGRARSSGLNPKLGQLNALTRATKPATGFGQLKNIGAVGR